MNDLAVVITTVGAPRKRMLDRALASVWAQTMFPDVVIVAQDTTRAGAPATRQRGTKSVKQRWVAYLDDDDEMYPHHLRSLMEHAILTGADLVYPWFDVIGGSDPFPHHEHLEWDNNRPHQIPVTFLARTEAVLAAGGWDDGVGETADTDPEGNRAGEDWRLTLRMVEMGYKISHLDRRTWAWHHHGHNSSGLPSRINWDGVEW